MNSPYPRATAVGLLIVALMTLFSLTVRWWVHRHVESAKASVQSAPETNTSEADFGMEVSGAMITLISFADLWLSYWFVFTPAILGTCLIVVWLKNR